jgi:hypothetical protein
VLERVEHLEISNKNNNYLEYTWGETVRDIAEKPSGARP